MKKFLGQKNKNKNKKGFTLVETLVALAIFSISIIGMMTVLSSGLSDSLSAKKKLTATFLAQEGIEYMRNIRDTYVLYWGTAQTGWDEFNNEVIGKCNFIGSGSSDKECFFDNRYIDYTSTDMPITDSNIIQECDGVGGCPFLTYDDGKYTYDTGENTTFVRSIRTKKVDVGVTEVTSTVSWDNNTKKISLSENLFNWTQ
jgi:prepilin-type N-terminal cleavage/methylation domain-containing protein